MRASELSRKAEVGERRQSNVPTAKVGKDFTILCSAVAENNGVIEAVYALYYLPQNFKLLVRTAGAKNKELVRKICEIIDDASLRERVTMLEEEKSGLSQAAAPISFVNAVVYGSSDPVYAKTAAQSIVVFDIASKLSTEAGRNFAVSKGTTPEALASAVLTVARRQA